MGEDLAGKNIRFLLWQSQADRRDWAAKIAKWAGGEISRAEAILRGAPLRQEEAPRLAKGFGITQRQLREKDVLEERGVDILIENVRFLLGSLERGQKGNFARTVGVHPATVSSWLADRQRPERPGLTSICKYFGLPAGTDLRVEPVFLSYSPVGAAARKKWLRDKIERMGQERLNVLFPALVSLLKDE